MVKEEWRVGEKGSLKRGGGELDKMKIVLSNE